METIIGLLAAAGLLILLVLSIPVDLAVNVETSATSKHSVRLIWLFGLLSVNLGGPVSSRKQRTREGRKHQERPLAAQRMWSAIRAKGFPATVARFIGRLFAAVTMRDFRLHV